MLAYGPLPLFKLLFKFSHRSSPFKEKSGLFFAFRVGGLVVRRPPREREREGVGRWGLKGVGGGGGRWEGDYQTPLYLSESHQWRKIMLLLSWVTLQAPGVIGSALDLVGPVSAYRDWVR